MECHDFIYISEVSILQSLPETRAVLKNTYFCSTCMYVHVPCSYLVPVNAEDPLELELLTVINCHVGIAIEPWSSQDEQVILTTEQSL